MSLEYTLNQASVNGPSRVDSVSPAPGNTDTRGTAVSPTRGLDRVKTMWNVVSGLVYRVITAGYLIS